MSLDNIQLPTIVLQDLFRKSLVDLETNEQELGVTESVSFNFLGENRNNIAILVESPGNAYLPEDQLQFLSGVLNACNLTLADVALINLANNSNLVYTTIIEKLLSQKMIIFGIPAGAIELPFTVPEFQVQKYNNCRYLLAPSIRSTMDDKPAKKRLWDSLKQLFEIN